MSQDLASLKLTDADVAALRDSLQSIRKVLHGRTVSLTPAQRSKLLKMGEKSRNFCTQAVDALAANAGSLPPDLDIAALQTDLADFNALDTFYTEFQSIGEEVDDTLKALSSDVMVNALAGVGFLKALNKLKPSLDKVLGDLRSIRRAKPKVTKKVE